MRLGGPPLSPEVRQNPRHGSRLGVGLGHSLEKRRGGDIGFCRRKGSDRRPPVVAHREGHPFLFPLAGSRLSSPLAWSRLSRDSQAVRRNGLRGSPFRRGGRRCRLSGQHGLHNRTLFRNVTPLVVHPADGQKVRIRIADLEPRLSELVDEVDDAVFEVDFGQAQNKRRNCVQKRAGTVGEIPLDPNSMVDGVEELIVGSEPGRVLGLSAFIEFADPENRRVHTS